MATTTFSGPIRAGTQRDSNAATKNVGLVVLTQTYDSGDMTGLVQGTVNTQFGIVPAGSQIIDIAIDQVVASTTGTTTVSIGNASAGAQLAAARGHLLPRGRARPARLPRPLLRDREDLPVPLR